MMKFLILSLAITGFGSWSYTDAQTSPERPKPDAKATTAGGSFKNSEIQDLIGAVGLAPPELAAEVLLRLVETGKIYDGKLKIEALRRAFYYAPSAKYPLRLIAAVPQARRTDSDAGIIWAALNNGMDALSIQCRVVHAMLGINQKRARDWFGEVMLPVNPHRNCADALVESPGLFYATAGEVADKGFDLKERREGRNLEFVRGYVHKISSPSEIAPALRMILELKSASTEDVSVLLREFSSAIEYIDASARSAFGILTPTWFQEFAQTIDVAHGRGLAAPFLFSSVRKLLIKTLNSPQCGESPKQSGQGVVESFNNTALKFELPPIEWDDLKASVPGPSASVSQFRSTPDSQKLMLGLKHLRFGTDEQQARNLSKPARPDGRAQFLTKNERDTREWQTEAIDYLIQLDNWKNNNRETEETYFNEVCFIYEPLIELMPSDSLRMKVLSNYLGFLKASPLKRDNPPVWYLHFARLLSPRDSEPEGARQVRSEILQAADPLMALFLTADRVLGTSKR